MDATSERLDRDKAMQEVGLIVASSVAILCKNGNKDKITGAHRLSPTELSSGAALHGHPRVHRDLDRPAGDVGHPRRALGDGGRGVQSRGVEDHASPPDVARLGGAVAAVEVRSVQRLVPECPDTTQAKGKQADRPANE